MEPSRERVLRVTHPVRHGSRLKGALFSVFERRTRWKNHTTINVHFIAADFHADKVATVKDILARNMPPLGIQFAYVATADDAHIRIRFDRFSNASYVGTDALAVSKGQPTMMLADWNDQKVVLHEFGHALGLKHEHQHPESGIRWDRDAVLEDFQGVWTQEEIERNILRTHPRTDDFFFTAFDKGSIMMYPLQKAHMLNEEHITYDGDGRWSEKDVQTLQAMYPVRAPTEPDDDPDGDGDGDGDGTALPVHPDSRDLNIPLVAGVALAMGAAGAGAMLAARWAWKRSGSRAPPYS